MNYERQYCPLLCVCVSNKTAKHTFHTKTRNLGFVILLQLLDMQLGKICLGIWEYQLRSPLQWYIYAMLPYGHQQNHWIGLYDIYFVRHGQISKTGIRLWNTATQRKYQALNISFNGLYKTYRFCHQPL